MYIQSIISKKIDRYYLLYNHPIHDYMRRVYLVDKLELVEYLKDNINYRTGDGKNVIISDFDFLTVMIFNHDGECFVV